MRCIQAILRHEKAAAAAFRKRCPARRSCRIARARSPAPGTRPWRRRDPPTVEWFSAVSSTRWVAASSAINGVSKGFKVCMFTMVADTPRSARRARASIACSTRVPLARMATCAPSANTCPRPMCSAARGLLSSFTPSGQGQPQIDGADVSGRGLNGRLQLFRARRLDDGHVRQCPHQGDIVDRLVGHAERRRQSRDESHYFHIGAWIGPPAWRPGRRPRRVTNTQKLWTKGRSPQRAMPAATPIIFAS